MNYTISNLPSYPQNGDHQQIVFDVKLNIPIRITKGEDDWWYYDKDRNQIKSNPKRWMVFPTSGSILWKLNFAVKGFAKSELAVKYALREYRKYLKEQIKLVNEELK